MTLGPRSPGHAELRPLDDEHVALRRVAGLAARDAPMDQVLAAIVIGASAFGGLDLTALLRYESDGSTEVVALDGPPVGIVVGMRVPGAGDDAVQRVWRTGRPASIDDLAQMFGPSPQVAHWHGFRSGIAAPISIHDSLWGVLVAVGRDESLLPEVGRHLANFAESAGAAIAAARSRRELRALAEEQTALRRVAELVARGADLDEVFTAVAVEASTLLGDAAAVLLRYTGGPGDEAVAVAVCNSPAPIGLRIASHASNPIGDLRHSSRPVRVDCFAGTELAELARELGVDAGVAVPIMVEGRVWGALTTSTCDAPIAAGTERRLTQYAELAGAAIANAENKARLIASRARVVATADETRRRLQRDVHDSAQQRLVHTIITLKLARDAIAAGRSAAALVNEALTNAERANNELRDIVRGILPASLTHGGLRVGLESLVDDFSLPVEMVFIAPRLSTRTETTAYFIVAEALTNVVKHAHATHVIVRVAAHSQTVAIDVRDDGCGGADPARGSGLTGLRDRVDAAEGTLTISSPAGCGTTVHATLPSGPSAAEPPTDVSPVRHVVSE